MTVRPSLRLVLMVTLAWIGLLAPHVRAGSLSLAMQDTDLAEVMAMLSRQHRVNILLSDGVEGEVSFSLYDTNLDSAIRSIASAAGYAVERRDDSYFIVEHEQAGKYDPEGLTVVESYEIRYADAATLEQTLTPFLSTYGRLTLALDRRLLIIEDTPGFVRRIGSIIRELDQPPQQILIEAKILEVALDDGDSFGIDWSKLFASDGGAGSFGTRELAGDGAGFFFDYATPNVEATLSALRSRGRVRTLSTPKLLTVQNTEASVIIGDRRGYQVTTTINQVTTESIEFLESGVILRVTPNVDAQGRVVMSIHPEVSNGSVDLNGIPSQTTTEVTTRLIVPDGQTIFIGGLMKHTATEASSGVPVLENLPGVGRLFSSRESTHINTETIVLITPRVISDIARQAKDDWNQQPLQKTSTQTAELAAKQVQIDNGIRARFAPVTDQPSATAALKMSPRTTPYTLYLFHAHSKRDATTVASGHADVHTASVRDGTQVVVMHGRYATEDAARTALRSLPTNLARFSPSVRRIDELTSDVP